MADFKSVAVDITAEELEERVKKPIDTIARENSNNFITSGAVYSEVKNAKIETDNLADGAVTRKKINESAVDMTVTKGSTNLVMSGAVANSFELFKADSDHIKDNAVTEDKIADGAVSEGKLANGAVTSAKLQTHAVEQRHIKPNTIDSSKLQDGSVTEDKIANDSIDTDKIKDMAVTPEKLDKTYAQLHYVDTSFSSDSQFHNYLVMGANEFEEPFKKVCLFFFRNATGWLSRAGSGRFYGFYASRTEFIFTKLSENNETFRVIFDDEKITSLARIGIDEFPDTGESPLDTSRAVMGRSIEARIGYIRKEIESSFSGLGENKLAITKVNFEEVTYEALWNAVKTHGAIMFDTLTESFTGAETELNLPLGCYVAFHEHGQAACWHFNSGVLYKLVGYDLFDTGDYTFYVTSSFVDLENKLGNIDAALDNIIAIQNSYIGGASE